MNGTAINKAIISYGPIVSPLLAVLIAGWLTYILFIKQKRYEETKNAYVVEGINPIISSINAAVLVSAHNWHQGLNILKSIREHDSHSILFEFYHYFKHLDENALKPIEHQRLGNAIGSTVFSSLHQACHASMTAYYHFLVHDFYVIAFNYLNKKEEIDRDKFIKEAEDLIMKGYEEIKSHSMTISLLIDVSNVIENTHMSPEGMYELKDNEEIKAILNKAEKLLEQDDD